MGKKPRARQKVPRQVEKSSAETVGLVKQPGRGKLLGNAAGAPTILRQGAIAGEVKSVVKGLSWPAIPSQQKLLTLGLLYQLEKSQWWSAERIQDHQFRQLAQLLHHAGQTVPFYAERFKELGFDPNAPLTYESWQRLPLLTRADIQENQSSLISSALPKAHGRTSEVFSSGSTGTPVRVRISGLARLFWNAFTARFHIWNGDDLAMKYGAIKTQKQPSFATYPRGVRSRSWGPALPFVTGRAVMLNINAKTHEQAEWLQRTRPDYLLSYPSILEALAKHCLHEGIELPSIKRVHTMSEVLRPEVRRVCKAAWDAEICDMYSTEETGYIALQCPQSEQLLVQAEGIYVEILDEDNRPCSPGQIGKVVVTPLHNFAMPLIRYEVGDFAEVGKTAACGRELQVIERVLGRTRNMVRLPNGHYHYPDFQDILDGFDHLVQFQIVRRAEEQLEMKMVARRELTPPEEDRLRRWLQERFMYPFQIEFTYHKEIARSTGGKFMDFISEID